MLQNFAVNQLKQLISLLNQIEDNDYAKCMEPVYNSSIGKHIRHIIEFHHCFFEAMDDGQLCYDNRKRNIDFETKKSMAIQELLNISLSLKLPKQNIPWSVRSCIGGESYITETTLQREFLYIMEHTTHHIASINIGLSLLNPEFDVNPNLGLAYSSLKFRN